MGDDELLLAYRAHRAALVEVAARVLGCRARAEDVVQDAYLKLVDRTAEGREEIQQPAAFLFRMIRNLAIDRVRRLALERRYGAGEAEPEAAPDSAPTPEAVSIARDQLRLLDRALAELPARTRLVFEMSRIAEMPAGEIARALSISERLVFQLLRDAMTHCRGRLFPGGGTGP